MFEQPTNNAERYEVQVGHARVIVDGHDEETALKQARSAFCREFPRLWDVIQTLAANRFLVKRLAG